MTTYGMGLIGRVIRRGTALVNDNARDGRGSRSCASRGSRRREVLKAERPRSRRILTSCEPANASAQLYLRRLVLETRADPAGNCSSAARISSPTLASLHLAAWRSATRCFHAIRAKISHAARGQAQTIPCRTAPTQNRGVPKSNLTETANFAATAFNELWNQCPSVSRCT